jgi:hypothetical protein
MCEEMALSILDVRSFRRADCDSDHCPAAAVCRESRSVSKREIRRLMWSMISVN